MSKLRDRLKKRNYLLVVVLVLGDMNVVLSREQVT